MKIKKHTLDAIKELASFDKIEIQDIYLPWNGKHFFRFLSKLNSDKEIYINGNVKKTKQEAINEAYRYFEGIKKNN